jgi:ribonuclease J
MSEKSLRLVPLGGLGEIGKNMMSVEYGDNILIVDTGLMFPENDMLGIDYVIPDFRYLLAKRDQVRGIVVTHGHEDHTGAIRHVLEEISAPIFATPLTRGLLEVKLTRGSMLRQADLKTIEAGGSVRIGPFEVEFFHVCHSIPDGVGLGITTPAGILVHSGDFKFDQTPVDNWPTDFGKLAELGGRGVLALLADSTNADKPGWTPSEAVIDPALDGVFRQAPGRILIGTFASLISRMAQAAKAAANHGRVMAFVGTSMVENVRISRKLGYLDIPDDLIVPLDQALSMPASRVVLMCTGTQGEPTSILSRLSTGTNRQFDLQPADTVVMSSHPIPGNEEMVHRTINRLLQRGASVIYDAIAPVHVSGHASQEEMKLLQQVVHPKFFIPIHGELRHLRMHAALAHETGIPWENIAVVENGTVIEFRNGEMTVGERIPGGYVFVDGSGVGDIGPTVMREREALARDGFVAVHLHVDRQTGRLLQEPEIVSKGFVFLRDAEELFELARTRIHELTKQAENGDLKIRVEKDLARLFFQITKRQPMIFVFTSSSEANGN